MNFTLGTGLFWKHGSFNDYVQLVRLCEDLGYDYLWIANEKFFRDMDILSATVALHTTRPYIGTFVSDPYTKHPALTTTSIGTLDEVSNGRAVLCFGAGGTGFPALGIKRSKPAQTIKESVLLVRELLKGGTVDFKGEYIQFNNSRLNFQPRKDIPIFVASRGDLVLQAGGEVADGVMIATYAEPRGIRHAMEMVDKGAKKAGRTLKDLKIISRVDACISDDRRAAYDAVRSFVGVFLWTSYPDRSFVHQVGLEVPHTLEAVIAKRDYNLLEENVALIPDEFIDKFCWAGTAEEVATKVAQVVDLGVDQITFLAHPVKGTTTIETIRAFVEVVRPRVLAELSG